MIWANGAMLPDDALHVSVLDRTFEHGIGLFETFRTWNDKPTLMSHHLDRMQRSARELGLTVDPAQLPDAQAVIDLIEANRASLPAGQDPQDPAHVIRRLRHKHRGKLDTLDDRRSAASHS